MTSPLAILGGFGQAATGLGTDLNTQAILEQNRRQQMQADALNRLVAMTKLGAMPAGANPQQTLDNLVQQRQGQWLLQNAPGGTARGGEDLSRYGTPQIAQLPTESGGTESYILDPANTPEALMERRMYAAQDAQTRRQQMRDDAAQERQAAAEKAKHDQAVAAAHGAFNSLQALASGGNKYAQQYVAGGFDPNNPLDYAGAFKNVQNLTAQDARNAAQDKLERERIAAMQPRAGNFMDPATDQVVFTTEQDAIARHLIQAPKTGGTASGSQASVDDMQQRLAEISQHAARLSMGQGDVSRAMQTREGLEYGMANASAGGHGVPVSNMLAAAGMDLFGFGGGPGNPTYDDYAALMNSTRALGDDVAKVFKGRQNEDAVKREIALAELTPGDFQNKTVVQQKLQRLQNVVNLAKATMPATQGVRAPAPGGAPQADLNDVAAWLKANPPRNP